DTAPPRPGERIRGADAGAKVIESRVGIARSGQGDGGNAPRPGREWRLCGRSPARLSVPLGGKRLWLSGCHKAPRLLVSNEPRVEDRCDKGAGADASIDIALCTQPVVGRCHRQPGDMELLGEVTRRWQTLPRAQSPGDNRGTQLRVDLAGQSFKGGIAAVKGEQ